MAEHRIKNIVAPELRMSVGSVRVREDGTLATRPLPLPVRFSFAWRDAAFIGTVKEADGHLLLGLETDIGALPFTAEDSARRRHLLSVIADAKSGPWGQIDVIDGRIAVVTRDLPVAEGPQVSVKALITSVAVAVLSAAPCLDFLAGRGVAAT